MKGTTLALAAAGVASVAFVNAMALLFFQLPSAPDPANAPTPVVTPAADPDPSPSAAPEPPELAALPAGPAAAQRALARVSDAVSSGRVQLPAACVSEPAFAWAYTTSTTSGWDVSVALMPAGQGGVALERMTSLAQACDQAVVTRGDDSVNISYPRADRRLSIVRHEDILVFIATPPDASTTEVTDLAQELISGIRFACIGDPGSGQNNPRFPDYVPYAPSTEVLAPAPAADLPSYPSSQTSYRADAAAQPRPDLAVLFPPNVISNPQNTPLSAAARKRTPFLVDPADIPEPPLPRPGRSLPVFPGTVVAGMDVNLPASPRLGPGCGWSFTGAQPAPLPPVDTQQATVLADQAIADAVAANADYLTKATALDIDYQQALLTVQATAQWDAYDQAVANARAELSDQQRKYQDSLLRWNSWSPPAPVPDPAAGPQDALPSSVANDSALDGAQ